MEAVYSSEILVPTYRITKFCNPDYHNREGSVACLVYRVIVLVYLEKESVVADIFCAEG
jgi:hypothetical protein